jgi:DNA-binding LacI/PurR family transcriptional regulator
MKFERSNSGSSTRVSLYEVARHADVSHQTVANVLNYPERVRPVTRDRVMASIHALGFEVSAAARSLGAGKSQVIGFAVPSTAPAGGSFLDNFLLPFATAAEARDYRVMLFAGDSDDAAGALKLIRTGAVDGIVLTDTMMRDPRSAALTSAGVPFVTFGRTGNDDSHIWVDVDNAIAVQLVLDRLQANGHREIAYLAPESTRFFAHERATVIADQCRVRGLTLHRLTATDPNPGESSGRVLVQGALASLPRLTAIIAGSDLLAATAVNAALESGRTVGPEHLAVIGFDDSALAAATSPAITSIHQPLDTVIDALITNLLGVLQGGDPESMLLEPLLTIRASG